MILVCVSVMDTIVLHVDRTINNRKRLGFTKNQMGGKIVCILNSVSITFIIIAGVLPFCKFSAEAKNKHSNIGLFLPKSFKFFVLFFVAFIQFSFAVIRKFR